MPRKLFYSLMIINILLVVLHYALPQYRWGQHRLSYFNLYYPLNLASWFIYAQLTGLSLFLLVHLDKINPKWHLMTLTIALTLILFAFIEWHQTFAQLKRFHIILFHPSELIIIFAYLYLVLLIAYCVIAQINTNTSGSLLIGLFGLFFWIISMSLYMMFKEFSPFDLSAAAGGCKLIGSTLLLKSGIEFIKAQEKTCLIN